MNVGKEKLLIDKYKGNDEVENDSATIRVKVGLVKSRQ